jgi:hypothetical protein
MGKKVYAYLFFFDAPEVAHERTKSTSERRNKRSIVLLLLETKKIFKRRMLNEKKISCKKCNRY